MGEVFANDATALVTAGGTDAPVAGTVQTWTLSGSTFPAISSGAGTFSYGADFAAPSEKILISDITGTTATVTRGADGTSPVVHASGFTLSQVISAATLRRFLQMTASGNVAFTASVTPKVVALADAATILVDASLGNKLGVTLGGNRIMGAPSNPADGQQVSFRITQDGTGSRTLTWTSGAGGYSFGSGSAPVLTATAGKTDLVAFEYDLAVNRWLYLGSALGF